MYNKTDEIIQSKIDKISSVFFYAKFDIINISFLKEIKNGRSVEHEKRYIKCNNTNGGGEKFGK